jgi:Flp pilus assembly protein TadD
LLQQALKLDPDYAYAWGTLSNAAVNLGKNYLTGDARQQAYAQARVAMDKQQALAPDAAATHMARGYLLEQVDHDPAGALAEFKRAYALAPNDGTVMGFLAIGLSNMGQLQPAVELYRKAIATDPLRTGFYTILANTLLTQGQLDAAEQATRKALALQPDYPALYLNLASIDMARGQLDAAEQALNKALALQPNGPGLYATLAQVNILRGDAAAAVHDAKKETDPVVGPWSRSAALQIDPDHQQADVALRDYIAKNGKAQPYLVAGLYGLRKQPDEMFEWLQRAWTQHDSNLIANLLNDPFVLAWQHDPRFAALCKQAGLPRPTAAGIGPSDPRAASTAAGTSALSTKPPAGAEPERR